MFSVDNFYDVFYANYGWEKTQNFLMVFKPHGSKDLHNLEPFGPLLCDNPNSYDRIVMHDQEPLFLDYLDTYRSKLENQKNSLFFANERQKQRAGWINSYFQRFANLETFKRSFEAGMDCHPIVCHSEINSNDIKILQDNGFITCYYWWHGMIARDWFRHWEHYKDLEPSDKSDRNYRFLLYCRDCTGTRTYRLDLLNHCRQYQQQILHAWDREQVDSDHSAKISIYDALSSAVHIVAETLFDTEKIYLTEKVFKPMVMSQPFILFGPPGSLEYLRSYGFKTFDDCWDESYDLITDSSLRKAKLLSLIDHLAEMSAEEFQNVYRKALPAIQHNRRRFYETAFQVDLYSEMTTNVESALRLQQERRASL